jgi:hypothetical protein
LENQISKPNTKAKYLDLIWSIFWRFGFDQIFLAKPNPNSSHGLQAILFQHFACGSLLFLFAKMADASPYDLTKGEHDLQRYFIYKAKYEDGKLKGECRKCDQDYSRNNGGTPNMLNHLEKCDKVVYDVYKSEKKLRKNNTAPSTPRPNPWQYLHGQAQSSEL